MATFVIVHGAWSGGHAWRWVRPLLRSAGHEVFTPALTGLGERSYLARSKGQGWLIPPPLPEPLPDDLDPRVRWAMLRMVPQPLATFAQPLRLTNPAGPQVPRAYVLCAQGKEDQALPGYVERARSDPGWRFVELAAGHSAHVTAPRELVNVLGQLVEHG
jgi:hypothetical protein